MKITDNIDQWCFVSALLKHRLDRLIAFHEIVISNHILYIKEIRFSQSSLNTKECKNCR